MREAQSTWRIWFCVHDMPALKCGMWTVPSPLLQRDTPVWLGAVRMFLLTDCPALRGGPSLAGHVLPSPCVPFHCPIGFNVTRWFWLMIPNKWICVKKTERIITQRVAFRSEQLTTEMHNLVTDATLIPSILRGKKRLIKILTLPPPFNLSSYEQISTVPWAKSLCLLTWWIFIEIACVLMGDVTSKVPPVPWVFPSPRTASAPAQASNSRVEASEICAFYLSCFKGILLIDFVSLTQTVHLICDKNILGILQILSLFCSSPFFLS